MTIYRRFRTWIQDKMSPILYLQAIKIHNFRAHIYVHLLPRLRQFIWGRDLGQVRRHLFLSVLAVGLLGGTAKWAEPRWTEWLYPPPPLPPAFCSRVAIELSKPLIQADVTAAKLWIGEPNTPILFSGLVWDEKDKRVELWMSDGKDTLWEVEFVCFKASLGHPMVFGEFEKYSFEEIAEYEQYQESIERLTK